MLEKLFMVNMFLAVFAGFSCNTTEAPTNIPLTLIIEDVSCTEAWLKVNAENANGVLFITKDQSKTIFQITNPGNIDTIVYVDSLLPNKTYTFNAVLAEDGKLIGTSEKVTGITLDTTSHNFAWETYSFGGGGEASFINDVAIVDENNIWACGEIYLPDSLGNPDDNIYNAIHWDGNNWTPKRISAEFRGNIVTLPLDGVFTFSATVSSTKAGLNRRQKVH